MSGIFGLYHRDGRPVSEDVLSSMRERMRAWGPHGQAAWHGGPCGFGRLLRHDTPEAPNDRFPQWLPGPRLAFTVAARLDARDELCDALDIPHPARASLADGDAVLRAYLRWGDACPRRLLGDWSFAAWHADERRLFVARDQQGVSTTYVFVDDRHVAFAANIAALLAVPGVPTTLDEEHLAKILTSWPTTRSTSYAAIERLPFGHTLTATEQRVEVRRYTDLDAVTPLRLAADGDYVEAFREVFTRAVADRLRTSRPVAIALSGGLDSGAVAATAARVCAPRAQRLVAISHVPRFAEFDVGNHAGDERPCIAATARAAGIADVTYLDSARITPMQGIRRALQIYRAPCHAAGNMFWVMDVLDTARDMGCGTVLTGQIGNVTISWPGLPATDWLTLWRQGWHRASLVAMLPNWCGDLLRSARRRWQGSEPWRAYSAIRPEFARRVRLAEIMAADDDDPARGSHAERALEARVRILGYFNGDLAEAAATHGLSIRDPTSDLRVVRFCLGVPEEQFVSPGGQQRWLIRRAMSDRLPPEVVWNRRRGRQSADLVMRLRERADEVEAALLEGERHPRAGEYVDVPYLRTVWSTLRRRNDDQAQRQSVTILARGLMAALFVATGERGGLESPARPSPLH